MILSFDLFRPFSDRLIHGVTTRAAGSFERAEQGEGEGFSVLERQAGMKPLFIRQLHGDQIWRVGNPEPFLEGDGLMTQEKGQGLAIRMADCVAALFYDPRQNAIAAIHAGWKGGTQNILGKAVEKMEREFGSDPADLRVALSPSIGPCCLEFTNPKKELPPVAHPFVQGRYLDLWSLSMAQLTQAGVKKIEIRAECTKCNPKLYFSHRNGDRGRLAAFIGLK